MAATPDMPEKKKVVILYEKNDIAPAVLLFEYDLIEHDPARENGVNVHIKNEKDDRWASADECMVIDNKVRFLVTAIVAKQAQMERHQKEIAKLVAQLKRYTISNDPAFNQQE